MRIAAFCLLLVACAAHDAAPATVVVPPQPPPPPETPVVVTPDPPPVPQPKQPYDFAKAKRVAISAVPLKAEAPKPIGAKPGRTARLHETARQGTRAAEMRADNQNAPYDPRRYNEIKSRPPALPSGTPGVIPLTFEKKKLNSIYESGGKMLVEYEPSLLAILDADNVETIVDMDPPSLPLKEEDRFFADIAQAQYADGILYVCRGYNSSVRTRQGYVTALDAATGELRWRSPAQTCGGILALVGDYVLTGYGEDIMPYQFKLLRRYDGGIVQSIPNLGAGLDMLVDGNKVVVETFRHLITYELR